MSPLALPPPQLLVVAIRSGKKCLPLLSLPRLPAANNIPGPLTIAYHRCPGPLTIAYHRCRCSPGLCPSINFASPRARSTIVPCVVRCSTIRHDSATTTSSTAGRNLWLVLTAPTGPDRTVHSNFTLCLTMCNIREINRKISITRI